MSTKNFFKILIITSFVFLMSVTPVFATTPTANATPVKAVLIASVNIQSVKIVSSKDNIFNISFALTNETGVQSGVKYGVYLMGTDPKNPFIADEKVYEESLTLGEKSNITKEIIYEAPKMLSGTYNLYLMVKNASGFTFGRVPIKEITLKSSAPSLLIITTSCFLQIVNEKSNTHYDLLKRVSINKDEILRLTCDAVNETDKALSVTPSFETFIGSTYGAVAAQIGGNTDAIAFKSKEKKTFSVNLPTVSTPQIYTTNIKLADSNISSNTINAAYIISGPNATIMNLSLDKDFYVKNETAKLSLLYSSTGDNSQLNLSVKATIVNDKNKVCISPISQPLIRDVKSPIVEIPVLIKNNCPNPNVSISILDDKGNVLDQKNFNVTSSQLPTPEKNSNTIILIFLIIILVVAGIVLYFRNLKKKQNEFINQ